MGYFEDKESMLNEALNLINSGSNTEAGWETLYELSDEEYGPAQRVIAESYYNNNDLPNALEWYKKAANNGDIPSISNMSYFYNNGIGVEKDTEASYYWVEKAAELGDVNAIADVANYYYNEKHDLQKGPYWLQKAAETGNSNSQTDLGTMYIGKDNAKAKYWLEKGADQGNVVAYYNLGNSYDRGLLEPDVRKAIYWFEKAASVESPLQAEAAYRLANIYTGSRGIDYNGQEMFKWASLGSELGHAYSMTIMTMIYRGQYEGFRADPQKELDYRIAAVEHGCVYSKWLLALNYIFGVTNNRVQLLKPDFDKAEQLINEILSVPDPQIFGFDEIDIHEEARTALQELNEERKKKKKWFFF